jgi:hypothetical protein
MGQARKGIWHGLVFRQNLQNLQNEKMGGTTEVDPIFRPLAG